MDTSLRRKIYLTTLQTVLVTTSIIAAAIINTNPNRINYTGADISQFLGYFRFQAFFNNFMVWLPLLFALLIVIYRFKPKNLKLWLGLLGVVYFVFIVWKSITVPDNRVQLIAEFGKYPNSSGQTYDINLGGIFAEKFDRAEVIYRTEDSPQEIIEYYRSNLDYLDISGIGSGYQFKDVEGNLSGYIKFTPENNGTKVRILTPD